MGLLCVLLACVLTTPEAPAEAARVSAVSARAASTPSWPADTQAYVWPRTAPRYEPLWQRVPAPEGFTRVEPEPFGGWLRSLPVRPAGTPLTTFRGDVLWPGTNPNLLAVIDLDVSPVDLQQCADTLVRLRGEWLLHAGADPAFRYTSGHVSAFSDWAKGERPVVSGRKVSWVRSGQPDRSRKSVNAWFQKLFEFAGTLSLAREGHAVPERDVQAGDFLVDPGSPGHAVMVMDVARNPAGDAVVLIGEGFMPAQDAHVLNGPIEGWYPVGGELEIVTWRPFPWSGLRRW